MSVAGVPYTTNFTDLSNDQGFQFEFFCERCGTGYKSTFKASKTQEVAEKASQGLGKMFGGRLTKVAERGSSMLQNVAEPKEKEKALASAGAEVQSQFEQCPSCGSWVCRDNCWNAEMYMCSACAAKEQVAPCPHCGAEVKGTPKFCPECGKSVAPLTCASCGTTAEAGTKFCPECGTAFA